MISVAWAVGILANGLGFLYLTDINWGDNFPLSLRVETENIFSCMFTFVLGWLAYSPSNTPRIRDFLLSLAGLGISSVLFYQLSSGVPYFRPDQFDTVWLAFSGLLTVFFGFLAGRVFSGATVLCIAIALTIFIFTSNNSWLEEVVEHSAAFWLIKSGAWSVFSNTYFLAASLCLMAFRADQLELGYRVKRQAFALLSNTTSLPISFFQYANSNKLFWSKLSIVMQPVMIMASPSSMDAGSLIVLCSLLFVVAAPLVFVRSFGKIKNDTGRKRTLILAGASLTVVLGGIVTLAFAPTMFAAAVIVSTLTYGVCEEADHHRLDMRLMRTVSVVYGGAFLLLLATVICDSVGLLAGLSGYAKFDQVTVKWMYIACTIFPIVVVAVLARLRGSLSKVSVDSFTAGLAVFLYFVAAAAKSPGMSSAFAVWAMLSGTLFGAALLSVFGERKASLHGVLSDLYGWASGSVLVLVPFTIVAAISAAIGSIIYYPVY